MSDEQDKQRLSTTVPVATIEWLRRRYPDANSDSTRLAMAISDARDFERVVIQWGRTTDDEIEEIRNRLDAIQEANGSG